jgi:hypothetical protein
MFEFLLVFVCLRDVALSRLRCFGSMRSLVMLEEKRIHVCVGIAYELS